jgi:hypothetical protein
MTQVQCISSKHWRNPDGTVNPGGPQFLNVYTVDGDCRFGEKDFFYLAEFPVCDGCRYCFWVRAFRPIEPLPPEEADTQTPFYTELTRKWR